MLMFFDAYNFHILKVQPEYITTKQYPIYVQHFKRLILLAAALLAVAYINIFSWECLVQNY